MAATEATEAPHAPLEPAACRLLGGQRALFQPEMPARPWHSGSRPGQCPWEGETVALASRVEQGKEGWSPEGRSPHPWALWGPGQNPGQGSSRKSWVARRCGEKCGQDSRIQADPGRLTGG